MFRVIRIIVFNTIHFLYNWASKHTTLIEITRLFFYEESQLLFRTTEYNHMMNSHNLSFAANLLTLAQNYHSETNIRIKNRGAWSLRSILPQHIRICLKASAEYTLETWCAPKLSAHTKILLTSYEDKCVMHIQRTLKPFTFRFLSFIRLCKK